MKAIRQSVTLILTSVPIFFFCQAVYAAPQRQKASSKPCYSFLLQGDVWVKCGAERRQITRLGNIDDFAVSTSGRGLALYRAYKVETFLFSPGGIRHRRFPPPKGGAAGVVQSCGTVMLAISHIPVSWALTYQDAFTGQPITKPPYVDFRCSSDGKIVAGFLDKDRHVLEAGFPPHVVYRPTTDMSAMVDSYDVSPNGKYVAYEVGDKLCVQALAGGKPECMSEAGNFNRVSVSEDGDVIYGDNYWNGLGDGVCYYRDRWHASLRPRPGYNDAEGCTAVCLWHSGLKQPKILVPLGTDPQWITPSAASGLIELSKRLAGAKR